MKSSVGVFHEMHEWEWMRWNIAPSVSVAPPLPVLLIFPSAVAPPPLHCQVACPGQMILECTTAATKTGKRKWHLCESIVRCKRQCLCIFGRPYNEPYEQIRKIAACPFKILSASYGGHFVTVSGQRYCVFLCD